MLAGLTGGAGVVSVPRRPRGPADVDVPARLVISRIGEIVARSLGYFEAEQII